MKAKFVNEDINDLFQPKKEDEINQGFEKITRNPNINNTIDNVLSNLKQDIFKSISNSDIGDINSAFQEARTNMLANVLNTLISETLDIEIEKSSGYYDSYWTSSSGMYASAPSRFEIGKASFKNGYELKIALNSTSNAVIVGLFKDNKIVDSTTSSKVFHTAIKKTKKLLKNNINKIS